MAAFAPTAWARETMDSGGYAALGALVVAENLFPPIPSEVILPLAGFSVGRGLMTFGAALLVATLASVAGALVLYALGRYGGRPVLLRWGRVLRLTEARLDRADEWFDAHGPKVVLFGRVVPGVRSVVSLPAGASEMPVLRFVALTALGSGVWNAALIGAGWALGRNWTRVEGVVGPAGTLVLVLAVVAAVAAVVVAAARRRAATGAS